MNNHLEFLIEPDITQECYQQPEATRELKVRLDKWLWAARFFKTRALARTAVENGKVLYNGKIVGPSTEIQLNAKINIRLGRFNKNIVITGLSTRRKNFNAALELFEELPLEDSQNSEFHYHNNGNAFGEYAHKKGKKVVRFLRRTLTRC